MRDETLGEPDEKPQQAGVAGGPHGAEASPEIGARLRAAREARGLSVEDVSASTRVRATLIRQIEADQFDGCGGAFYARGHIRGIAAVVGLDPRPLIEAFDREQAPDSIEAVPMSRPGLAREAAKEATRAEGRRSHWTAVMAVALAIVSLIALVSLLSPSSAPSRDAADQAGATSAAPAPSSSTPSAPAPAQPSPPPDALALVPSQSGVTLRVRITTDKSWVRVSNAANAQLFQGVLSAGDVKDFSDPASLRLTIGNAGVVNLVVNGRDYGTPGAVGQVARVVFGPGEQPSQGSG